MKLSRNLCLAAALSLSIAGTTYATTTKTDTVKNQTDVTKLVESLTKNQVKVVETFPSVGNLVGVVIEPKGAHAQQSIIYVDQQGRYLLSGALIAANGDNVSQLDNKKYIATKVADSAYTDLGSTHWVQEGKATASHVLYVIADPNCMYCHKLYEQSRAAVKSGDVMIRWIWVGFLKPSSATIAQSILGAKDPVAMMEQVESQFSMSQDKSTIKTGYTPTEKVRKAFQANMNFINKYNFPGTPVILYKNKAGEAEMSYGLPDDAEWKSILDSAVSGTADK